jgi:signal transduction histidine kinase
MNVGEQPSDPPSDFSAAPGAVAGLLHAFIGKFNEKFGALTDSPIPPELLADPETARRARLITRFGVLGSIFGISYAIFYLLIGHHWGSLVVLVCSSGVVGTPFLMRWSKSVELAGNFLSLTLTFGFTGLCFVEGGIHGHAIAWLVSVPLCALLVVGERAGSRWAVIAFAAAAVVAALDLGGIKLPAMYDPRWNSIVSSAGYLGLVLFMLILGLIFESVRARAAAKMQEALAELAASNERLMHLNNEKNEFLGIAAHDLKNPLTVIAGSAQLVTMTKDHSHISKLARNIVSAAMRMRDLIADLLDANAIEQGKFSSNIERCDVSAVVQQCVENNQLAAAQKKITFRVGTSENLWAKADRAATLQILDNLVSNALKFSPPNTTVQLHTLPEKDHVLVTVRDEGPGISEEDQKKLFQKFTRLSARPTAGESSTGLGLAIVKRLAESMSGTVQCHSALGSGATFSLRLPVWTLDSPTLTASSAVLSSPAASAKPLFQVVAPEPVPRESAKE